MTTERSSVKGATVTWRVCQRQSEAAAPVNRVVGGSSAASSHFDSHHDYEGNHESDADI